SAVRLGVRAVRPAGEQPLRDAGDDQRVDDAGHQGQYEEGSQAGAQQPGCVRDGVVHADQHAFEELQPGEE
ncbi:hypothetical protein STRTUCAR8_01074, partial [Streptomyces turgidiscabies Car8]